MTTRHPISRLVPVAALAAAFVSLPGCDRDPPPPLPGQIEQPAATAIAAGKLFVASPPVDALYVLDIASEAFVRAPNPLFSLEVPAVRRPTFLHVLPARGEDERDLILALSSVDRQMRVIDAEAMVPLGRPVELPGRPVAIDHWGSYGAVFVAVVWPDEDDAPGAVSSFFVSPEARSRGGEVALEDSPVIYDETFPLDVVPGGMAVSDQGTDLSIWVSDQNAARVLRLDLFTGTSEEIATRTPLSSLTASPDATNEAETLPRGRFIYGLTQDGMGLIALDATVGNVVSTQLIDGLVQPLVLPSAGVALSIAPRAIVDVGQEDDRLATLVTHLVLVAMLDGRILYVDGTRMAPIDAEGRQTPDPWFSSDPPVNLLGADGLYTRDLDRSVPVLVTVDNPDFETGGEEPPFVPQVDLTPGVTRSRTWRISWRGELSGLSPALGVVDDEGASVLLRPSAPVTEPGRLVLPTDRLQIQYPGVGEAEGCEAYRGFDPLVWEVSEVDPTDGAMTLLVVDGGPPLPTSACFEGEVVFRVRAGGYMVRGDGIDQVFRLEPGETFEFQGERFLRTSPLAEGPEIRFTLAETQDDEEMAEGAERRLIVRAGFDAVTATPDTTSLGVARATMIGRPSVHREETARYGGGRVFVPYAGAGYLISFDLRTRGFQRVHQ